MKRSLLVWSAIILFAFFAILRTILWLERDTVAALITEQIRSVVPAKITINQPSIDGLSYTAQQLIISSNRQPLVFVIENLVISPKLSSLLFGEIRFLVNADLYKGTINGDFSRKFIGKGETYSILVNKIDLNAHPQLKSFGIRSGVLTANAKDLLCNYQECTKGALSASLQEFEANLMFIGAVGNGSLLLRSHFTSDGLRIENINSKSSLFEAEGEGSIPYSNSTSPSHPFYLAVKLTPNGKQQLAPLLGMIKGAEKSSTMNNFDIYWRGSLRNGGLQLR